MTARLNLEANRPCPGILGFEYEEGAYWRKGSKQAPMAIRHILTKLRPFSLQANRRLQWPIDDYFVPTPDMGPYDKDSALARIDHTVAHTLTTGRAPVVIGGDHSISLPVVQALARHHGPKRFSILHFDAHSDTFPGIDGYDYHHGAVFRKMVELDLVDAHRIHQIGIRGLVPDGAMAFALDSGFHIVSVNELREKGCTLESLGITSDEPYYVSFDIDAVDPAFAPGTGTPVPGGLTSSEILALVEELTRLPLVGFDLVEVAPVFDTADITVLLAAHIVMEILIGGRFVTSLEGAIGHDG